MRVKKYMQDAHDIFHPKVYCNTLVKKELEAVYFFLAIGNSCDCVVEAQILLCVQRNIPNFQDMKKCLQHTKQTDWIYIMSYSLKQAEYIHEDG